MNDWLDRAGGWARRQGEALTRAQAEMADARLAAEGEMRQTLRGLPQRLAERLALETAPRKAADALKLRGPVAPEPVSRGVRVGPLGSDSDLEFKNGDVRLEALSPEMTRLYPDIVDTWSAAGGPRPVITSGNDGLHGKGSLHYRDRALDLRGNNVDARTAGDIRDRLAGKLGPDYDVLYETFPANPSNNHFHIEYDPKPKAR